MRWEIDRAGRFVSKGNRYDIKREENHFPSRRIARLTGRWAARLRLLFLARSRSSPRARKTYSTIVPGNEFTQVQPQVDTPHTASLLTPPSSREQSHLKGRHISRLSGCLCLPARAGSTRSSSSSLPGCCRGNRPGFPNAFPPCRHLHHQSTYPRVGFLPAVSRVASAPGRRSSKGRKHGFTSARHSFGSEASVGTRGRGGRRATGLRGLRRESLERDCRELKGEKGEGG